MLENVGMGMDINMLKIAVDFVKSLGLDVKVIEWNGTLGNYNTHTDTISLNIRNIIKVQKQNKKKFSYADSITKYIKLIVCHELGHRDDHEVLKPVSEYFEDLTKEYAGEEFKEKILLVDNIANEIKEKVVARCVQREMTAWEKGKEYVKAEDMDDYNSMNSNYLDERIEGYTSEVNELIRMIKEKVKLQIKKEVHIEMMSKKDTP
jgi:hypothetical protein